ncbi:hypothetical protein [Mycolicibacterium komossense]|uniref:Uncharacterized protein n=1 Tax=Mycolicibacterium komossense TaxID=1779 RepID=A0ABT3C4P9_9MYCO|nr:hypothetical protein [Mycolicibacterium komossense]MCV7224450.1 hypothetical protein [Mycolicibacterium komossense]
MTTKFKFNDLEPKNERGSCASILTWQRHSYVMARLETGWWAATHQFEGGPVTVLTPPGGVKSGHQAYNIALDHKNALLRASDAGQSGARE